MPRIIIKEQPSYEFQYNTTVHARDLNYANHLGNDSLVGIIQDARIGLFKKLGYTELDLVGDDGTIGIILADLVVNFKAEGFMFDELRIDSHIGEISEKSFRIFHRISKVNEDLLLALAETGVIAFNYKTRNVVAIPESFKKAFGRYKQNNGK